jgi:hypothetical protein
VGSRNVAVLDGHAGGVRVDGTGASVVWVQGTDFGLGSLEVDVKGRDVFQQSFLGIAFHRQDDSTYEDIYVRPVKFRATDPARHQHAVQYEAMPQFPWSRLRKEFPEEFENPVDESNDPNEWVPLRVVVTADRVQAFVGRGASPALEVRRLTNNDRGQVSRFKTVCCA